MTYPALIKATIVVAHHSYDYPTPGQAKVEWVVSILDDLDSSVDVGSHASKEAAIAQAEAVHNALHLPVYLEQPGDGIVPLKRERIFG